LQAVTSYLARDEVGVSQAIGVGGRDLSAEVGGLMFQVAVEALLADPQTEVLVLVSKPPEPAVAERVLALIQGSPKPGGGFNRRLPTVVCFLGGEKAPVEAVGAHFADTLAEAAAMAGALARGLPSGGLRSAVGGRLARSLRELRTTAVGQRERLAESQRFVRGLFAGGTFCYEAQVVLTTILGPVHSNTPLAPAHKLASPLVSVGHTCIDLGGDEFTQGRLHPMLDPTLRNQRLRREASDPLTGCILLDVVLGYGAHPDPAGDLAPVIVQARQWAERHGRYLPVVVSVCGTPGDPQGLADQEKKLRDAGALVVPTNAAAARLAGWICKRDA
jgi:FdrA protein